MRVREYLGIPYFVDDGPPRRVWGIDEGERVEQKPSVGRIVLFRSEYANGEYEHPAIVTHVWSPDCVNLTVFPDFGTPVSKGSVVQNESLTEGNQTYAWRWPPRV